jgi:hypothetical protein
MPPAPSGRTNGNGTTTQGAGEPPMLMTDLVAAFPRDGRFDFYQQRVGDELIVWKSDRQSSNDEPTVAGRYTVDPDTYYHTDNTGTFFRLWRTSKARQNPGRTSDSRRPGLTAGRKAASAAAQNAARLAAISKGWSK